MSKRKNKKKLQPYKERKPIPRPGTRFTDRKKERNKKACRKKVDW